MNNEQPKSKNKMLKEDREEERLNGIDHKEINFTREEKVEMDLNREIKRMEIQEKEAESAVSTLEPAKPDIGNERSPNEHFPERNSTPLRENPQFRISKRKKKRITYYLPVPKFELDCVNKKTIKLPTYNALNDNNLAGYFDKPTLKNHLRRMRLINKMGVILGDDGISNYKRKENRSNIAIEYILQRKTSRPKTGFQMATLNKRKIKKRNVISTEKSEESDKGSRNRFIPMRSYPERINYLGEANVITNSRTAKGSFKRKYKKGNLNHIQPISKQELDNVLADYRKKADEDIKANGKIYKARKI